MIFRYPSKGAALRMELSATFEFHFRCHHCCPSWKLCAGKFVIITIILFLVVFIGIGYYRVVKFLERSSEIKQFVSTSKCIHIVSFTKGVDACLQIVSGFEVLHKLGEATWDKVNALSNALSSFLKPMLHWTQDRVDSNIKRFQWSSGVSAGLSLVVSPFIILRHLDLVCCQTVLWVVIFFHVSDDQSLCFSSQFIELNSRAVDHTECFPTVYLDALQISP